MVSTQTGEWGQLQGQGLSQGGARYCGHRSGQQGFAERALVAHRRVTSCIDRGGGWGYCNQKGGCRVKGGKDCSFSGEMGRGVQSIGTDW